MRAFVALLLKEARQHALVSAGLFVTVGLAYALVLLGSLANDGVTLLDAHAAFERIFLPIVAVFLGHRLVVSEYSVKTQLFLEGLPIPRGLFVLVKALVFVVILFAISAGSLLLVFGLASLRESITLLYFAIVAARTLVWTLFLFAFFFSMGFVGRYRYPIFVFLGIALLGLDQVLDVEATDFGPIALVNHTFVLERDDPPWLDLATTSLASIALLVLALAIALAKSGSIAENLARRLSAREKSVVGGIVIAGLISLSAFEEEPESFEPVTEGRGWLAGGSGVNVYYGREEHRAAATRLREVVELDVASLRAALGVPSLPAIAVVFRDGLAAGEVEAPGAFESRVAIVRVNPAVAGADLIHARAAIVREALVVRSEGRADFEPHAWMLDGFPEWFVGSDRALALRRASHAFGTGGLDRDRIRRWHRTREELGPPIATALAESGLDALESMKGREVVFALAKATFGRPVRSSSLSVTDELFDPPDALFEEAAGTSFDAFLERWIAVVRSAPIELDARIEVTRGEGAIRTLSLRAPVGAVLVHEKLGPFDTALDEAALARTSADVVGVYAPGDRVFTAVELPSEALGCAIRVAARRIEIE
jgi:hypothetical protein